MSTKQGEEEHSNAALPSKGLQGAKEAVAHEVAAAEPEMPSLLAEPPAEEVRVAVFKFEKHSRSTMATMPLMPALTAALFPEEKPPPLISEPVFGGAARAFLNSTPADAEQDLSPYAEALAEAFDEDSLGETTPSLSMVVETLEEEEEPPATPKPQPYKATAALHAPTPASQAKAAMQPWLPAPRKPGKASSDAVARNLTRPPEKDEGPGTRPMSGWFVWSISIVLSVIVASGVFFIYRLPPPPPAAPPLTAERLPPRVVDPLDPNPWPAVPSPPGNRAEDMPRVPPPTQVEPVPPEKAPEKAQVAPEERTALEQMLYEESLFLEGLKAARGHLQKDQFARALKELTHIQALHKKLPVRSLEFEFLYALALTFTANDTQQTLRALKMLEALRDAYRINPDYWHASGFSNQLLGMDPHSPTPERRKHLQQAREDYKEAVRLGKNNAKYKQANSYIEHIEQNLRELAE